MKIKIFVIEFVKDGQRQWYHESLPSKLAYALGRELARRGRRPTVRRIDVPPGDLDQLLARYGRDLL